MAGVPFKVCIPCNNVKIGVVARSLQHLQEVLKEKFGFSCSVISLEDGTIVCSEEYFNLLEPQTSLVVQQPANRTVPRPANSCQPGYAPQHHRANGTFDQYGNWVPFGPQYATPPTLHYPPWGAQYQMHAQQQYVERSREYQRALMRQQHMQRLHHERVLPRRASRTELLYDPANNPAVLQQQTRVPTRTHSAHPGSFAQQPSPPPLQPHPPPPRPPPSYAAAVRDPHASSRDAIAQSILALQINRHLANQLSATQSQTEISQDTPEAIENKGIDREPSPEVTGEDKGIDKEPSPEVTSEGKGVDREPSPEDKGVDRAPEAMSEKNEDIKVMDGGTVVAQIAEVYKADVPALIPMSKEDGSSPRPVIMNSFSLANQSSSPAAVPAAVSSPSKPTRPTPVVFTHAGPPPVRKMPSSAPSAQLRSLSSASGSTAIVPPNVFPYSTQLTTPTSSSSVSSLARLVAPTDGRGVNLGTSLVTSTLRNCSPPKNRLVMATPASTSTAPVSENVHEVVRYPTVPSVTSSAASSRESSPSDGESMSCTSSSAASGTVSAHSDISDGESLSCTSSCSCLNIPPVSSAGPSDGESMCSTSECSLSSASSYVSNPRVSPAVHSDVSDGESLSCTSSCSCMNSPAESEFSQSSGSSCVSPAVSTAAVPARSGDLHTSESSPSDISHLTGSDTSTSSDSALIPANLQSLHRQSPERLAAITHSDYTSSPVTSIQIRDFLSRINHPVTAAIISSTHPANSLVDTNYPANTLSHFSGHAKANHPQASPPSTLHNTQCAIENAMQCCLASYEHTITRVQGTGERVDQLASYVDSAEHTITRVQGTGERVDQLASYVDSAECTIRGRDVEKCSQPTSSPSKLCLMRLKETSGRVESDSEDEDEHRLCIDESAIASPVFSPPVATDTSSTSKEAELPVSPRHTGAALPLRNEAAGHSEGSEVLKDGKPTVLPCAYKSSRCGESPLYPDEGYRSATPDTGKEAFKHKSFSRFLQTFSNGRSSGVESQLSDDFSTSPDLKSNKKEPVSAENSIVPPCNWQGYREESHSVVMEKVLVESNDCLASTSSSEDISIDTAMLRLTSKDSTPVTPWLSPASSSTKGQDLLATALPSLCTSKDSTPVTPWLSPASSSRGKDLLAAALPSLCDVLGDVMMETVEEDIIDVCECVEVVEDRSSGCESELQDMCSDADMCSNPELQGSTCSEEEEPRDMTCESPLQDTYSDSELQDDKSDNEEKLDRPQKLVVSIPRKFVSREEFDVKTCEPLVVTIGIKCCNGKIVVPHQSQEKSPVDSDFMDLDSEQDDSDYEIIDLTRDTDDESENNVAATTQSSEEAPLPTKVKAGKKVMIIHHEEMVHTLPHCFNLELDRCVGRILAEEYRRQRRNADVSDILSEKCIRELQSLVEKGNDSLFSEVLLSGSHSDIRNEIVFEAIPLGNVPAGANEETIEFKGIEDPLSSSPSKCTLHVSSSSPIDVQKAKKRRGRPRKHSTSAVKIRASPRLSPTPPYFVKSPRLSLLPPRLRPYLSKLHEPGPRTRANSSTYEVLRSEQLIG